MQKLVSSQVIKRPAAAKKFEVDDVPSWHPPKGIEANPPSTINWLGAHISTNFKRDACQVKWHKLDVPEKQFSWNVIGTKKQAWAECLEYVKTHGRR